MNDYNERVSMIRRTYDAFNRRDIDAVISVLDPEVDWPNILDGVRIRGHDAVREYWERQFREIDPHVELTGFAPNGDGVIVTVHQIVRDLDGNLLSDSHIAHVYEFRGEKVISMSVYASVEPAKNN